MLGFLPVAGKLWLECSQSTAVSGRAECRLELTGAIYRRHHGEIMGTASGYRFDGPGKGFLPQGIRGMLSREGDVHEKQDL